MLDSWILCLALGKSAIQWGGRGPGSQDTWALFLTLLPIFFR